MMLRKKNANIISSNVEKFDRMLQTLCKESMEKSIEELKIDFEIKLLEFGAEETDENKANLVLRVFAEFPDPDCYNILGCRVYFKKIFGWYRIIDNNWYKCEDEDRCCVRYSGVCGDVNTSYPHYKDYYYSI